ncbi:hypothetical protein L596_021984 [Steinernema carpocapsae]|uniref:Uncharacterized protein n=1 Tax=Steinernema carpocapsae TaxID=34508 RepID=A0A4U5MKR3_STECR|nr:hypothetical protein L596_021984 [Steinernema carpocapsae]
MKRRTIQTCPSRITLSQISSVAYPWADVSMGSFKRLLNLCRFFDSGSQKVRFCVTDSHTILETVKWENIMSIIQQREKSTSLRMRSFVPF